MPPCTNANWAGKKHQDLVARFRARANRPWMTPAALDGYAQVHVYRDALEKAGTADRRKVADAIRNMNPTGGAGEYVQGPLKWDDKGRRVGAGLVIAHWRGGQPVAVYPPAAATHQPVWVGTPK